MDAAKRPAFGGQGVMIAKVAAAVRHSQSVERGGCLPAFRTDGAVSTHQ
jgi:hypothetical protein